MTPRCPMYRGVETPLCPMNRGVFFVFFLTFKPMLQPLKQHSLKKLLILAFIIQIEFKHIWKIFLAEGFWGDSPVSQAPGSHFKMPITQPKGKKNLNGPRTSQVGSEWTDWWKKTGCKKSCETVPLNSVFLSCDYTSTVPLKGQSHEIFYSMRGHSVSPLLCIFF